MGVSSCGLLLFFLCVCSSLEEEEECVLGIVGNPVSLPCVRPELVGGVNVSIEWRRGGVAVLRGAWRGGGAVEEWSVNRATTPPDAPLTGDVSLQLALVDPTHDGARYSLRAVTDGNQTTDLCTACLRTAGHFSFPLLEKVQDQDQDQEQDQDQDHDQDQDQDHDHHQDQDHDQDQDQVQDGVQTSFLCQSSGGFPEPSVYWLINHTDPPPPGAVRTSVSLQDSLLYNVSSTLRVLVDLDTPVSCVVENPVTNETLKATTYGGRGSPVKTRATEGMWMFSTGLCVVVGVLVLVGVAYQIHLDRISKRKKKLFLKQQLTSNNKGYERKRRQRDEEEEEEEEVMKSKETDV